MDEPAQHIPTVDTQAIVRLRGRIRPRVRRPETQTAVGPLGVVVGDVDPKDPLQMSVAEHERPVEALGPDGPDWFSALGEPQPIMAPSASPPRG